MYYYYKHCYRVITIIQSTVILYSHTSRSSDVYSETDVRVDVTFLNISRCNVTRTAAVRSRAIIFAHFLSQWHLQCHIFLDVLFAQTDTFKVYIHLINIIYWCLKGSFIFSGVFVTNTFIRTAVKSDNCWRLFNNSLSQDVLKIFNIHFHTSCSCNA